MTDRWLDLFANWGQTAAALFALGAAILGLLGTYANQKLTARSAAQLIAAGTVITDLRLKVGAVIGDVWPPLSSRQIEQFRQQIINWGKPKQNMHVMYENEFGKEFAESLAVAFRAAGWKTELTTGGGFGRGIEVGPGPDGKVFKAALENLTGSKDIRIVRPDENSDSAFIGVGAKAY